MATVEPMYYVYRWQDGEPMYLTFNNDVCFTYNRIALFFAKETAQEYARVHHARVGSFLPNDDDDEE